VANLRVIYDNAADRAVVTASSTFGQMVPAHLLSDIKGLAHRSIGPEVTYTLAWPTDETVAGVGLPATNATPDALIRVRAFDADDILLADTGEQLAAPAAVMDMWDWTLPLNSNAFAFGGAVKVAAWLPDHVAARRLEITISDPQNPAGYIDCSRIVAGGYWSPEHNPDYGLTLERVDTTTGTRADSGDLRTERGPGYDQMAMDLSVLRPDDRARFMQILRSTEGGRRIFVSVFPGDDDPLLEQDHMIYGHMPRAGVVAAAARLFTTKIQLQGW
jgi:hypothetical protein